MADPTGLINGSKYLLYKNLQGGDSQLVGAITVNSSTYSRDVIDLTNKASQEHRELMDGDEGTKSAEHSVDCLFSDDTAYREMREAYDTGLIETYTIHFGNGKTQDFNFKVSAMSDSSEVDNPASTSVTLMSSSNFIQEA